jgi:porin-like protein
MGYVQNVVVPQARNPYDHLQGNMVLFENVFPGADMTTVKGLLLGTAAGLVAVAGAQAADLPVKAAPVQYVKICSLYGDGFYYIPGTDTCIKMGGYLRVQGEYNMGQGGQASGSGTTEGAQARYTRDFTNDFNYRVRGAISWDVRQQTEYGTLRTYIRFGAENTTPNNTGAATTFNPFWDRAFIQFAGFTVGRSQSFFDLATYGGAYSYHNVRVSGDTGASGQNLWAYTAQFGNGFSGTLSLEDPATRKNGTIDVTVPTFWAANGATTPDSAFAIQATTLNGFRMPDIVANGRVDQAWGFAGVSAAIHDASGAYYGTANNVNNGHPADKIGWAVAAGGQLNLPGGDAFGVNVCYTEGAPGFCTNQGSYQNYNASTSVGLGWINDGVFGTGTQVELTKAWSALAYYQHIWNPRWRTSWFGGYVQIDYNTNATNLINGSLATAGGRAACGVAAGVAGAGAATFAVIAPGAGNSCNPDWSFYEIGTRTQFNPVPQLDIGLELLYTHVNTAYKGPATVAANTSRPAVPLIDDQNVWSAMLRWQRNFYP